MLGYFFGAITAFVAVVALAIGLFNIPATVNGTRHYPRPVIARTVMVETQRHSPSVAKESSPAKSVAKEASSAKDVSPVVATAKADTKKSKHHKPKVFPVSATTTAIGTPGVMPKEISFSADPAHG